MSVSLISLRAIGIQLSVLTVAVCLPYVSSTSAAQQTAPPQIITSSLPGGQVQSAYSATLAASGGTTPYAWSIITGTLPAGLSLDTNSGAITGTATAPGLSTFTVIVADAASQSATAPLSINIAPATLPASPAIPAIFFGMALQETSTNWPSVAIGALRTSSVSWRKIETRKGIFDWGEMDRQVAQALQHGARVYYTTDGIPSWFSASNLADWDDFVTALATRYKGKIEIYELWNEPEYDNLPPLATFVVMTQHMRDIIRSIDPAAKIASPGVDTTGFIDGFWAAGGPRDVDVVGFHGYPYGSQPETIVQKAAEMKGYMSKYGINRPLYDSEGSYGSDYYGVVSTADKTNFIPRYELLHWSSGIARHYWYAWDDSTDASNGIGWGTLYDAVKNQSLPMAATYQQTYNWMVGATMSTPCSMAADSTWTCVLTRPGGYQALAIWNPASSRQYTPAGIYTQYRDVSGNVIPVSGSVTIGASPILLEASGGAVPLPTLQITTSSLPGGQTGSAYNAGVVATGGTAPYAWSITTGALPAGLSLNAATGAITGTPTTAAVSNFTVRVDDSGGSPQSATAQFSITVSSVPPPPPLVITTSNLAAGQVGTAYGATLAASGGTAPYSWSITVGSLPAGLTLNAGSGAISGTPTASGQSTFTVRVADSAASPQSATAQFSINVTPAPVPLVITTSSLAAAQVGTAYGATLAASGGTGPYSWSITVGSLPAGLTMNAGSGAISGTPTASGQSTFTVRVADSAASPQSATAQLSINVTPAPVPLVITTSSLAAGQVGTAYGATLAASGGTAPYSWSITVGSLPAGLTMNAGSGAISGTPTASGQSTFTVRVSDSAASPQSATAQFSINVTPAPVPLVITTSSLAAGQVGTAYGATLAASGGTAPYSWSITVGSLPAGLTLNASSGAISGTPTASGQSTFTVKVADSAASPQSATAQLSINVTPAPVPLVITTSSLAAGQVGTAYGATLAASGGTAPYSWSITVGSLPAGLTMNAGSGAISGTPTASGQSAFTVKVADSAASPQSATAQFSINVTPATLRIQTTSLPNGQVNVAYSTTMAAQGGTPPYTWAVFGTLPAGLSLNSSTGSISGTATTAATSSFTMQVTDSASQTASGPFSITVDPATTATAFNHVVVVVEENTNYSDVIGGTQMPYLNSLASQYGLATQYYADTHPSIGNYLMMTTGQVITNDDAQTPSTLPVSVDNVVRHLIAGGKTWKSYAEDLPSVGYTGGDTGNYAVRHNPLAYLTDVQSNATQKQNLVPFTQFSSDRSSGTLPNYAFVVPNLCNDAHDCGLNVADSWLQTNIAPLVNDANFQKDGLLIILFDESGSDNAHGGGRVPLLVVTPQAKNGFQSTTLYQHESLLRLTLQALGVQSWPGAAASAPAMSEFFTVPLP